MRWLDWYGDGSVYVVHIALACCALEFEAAAVGVSEATMPASVRAGTRVVVVVSGTVTDRLAPAVAAIVDACAGRGATAPTVVSFGACASSGGPYWDSYAVTKGVGQLVPVDVFVPGCPPPPAALADVLDTLVGRVSA